MSGFIDFCAEGDLEEVDIALKQNPVVYKTVIYGTYAMHSAALHGKYEVVDLLLKSGAHPNGIEPWAHVDGIEPYDTPLHAAASCSSETNPQDYIRVIKLLIKAGANVNAMNSLRRTPLHVACRNNHLSIVRLLISDGNINIHSKSDKDTFFTWGPTPLLIACEYGNAVVVKFLLEKWADPNLARGDDGDTPLHVAATKGYVDIARLLMRKLPNPDVTNRNHVTPLMKACYAGKENMVKFLLDEGADAFRLGVRRLNVLQEMKHPIFHKVTENHNRIIALLEQRMNRRKEHVIGSDSLASFW
jgi:ankyrin repeat protein